MPTYWATKLQSQRHNYVPHAENLSRLRPITGTKREATEPTEQGETVSCCVGLFYWWVSPCSFPQETSVRRAVREENGLRTLSSWSVDGNFLREERKTDISDTLELFDCSVYMSWNYIYNIKSGYIKHAEVVISFKFYSYIVFQWLDPWVSRGSIFFRHCLW